MLSNHSDGVVWKPANMYCTLQGDPSYVKRCSCVVFFPTRRYCRKTWHMVMKVHPPPPPPPPPSVPPNDVKRNLAVFAIQQRVFICRAPKSICFTWEEQWGGGGGGGGGRTLGQCVKSFLPACKEKQDRNIFFHNTGRLVKFGWILTYLRIRH